jgi:hypothetical protein
MLFESSKSLLLLWLFDPLGLLLTEDISESLLLFETFQLLTEDELDDESSK